MNAFRDSMEKQVASLTQELDSAEIDAVVVPKWAEDMLADVKDSALRQSLGRLYQIGRAKERQLFASTGYRTFDEYEHSHREEQIMRSLISRGIPDRLAIARFEGSSDTSSLLAAKKFVLSGADKCLILAGPTGIGKSWAMACIAERLQREEAGFHWLHASELFAQISVAEIRYASLANSRMLLIDDLGAEEDRSARAKFDALVYHRHGKYLPMVATTNLNSRQLRDRYGDRVLDRVAEWGQIIEVGGSSLRRAG